jgi:predicted TIM-barrel fold metal-dependent hydrolase
MTRPGNDTEVPAFWRGLGLPGLADIHVHFPPPRLHRGSAQGIYQWSDDDRVAHLRALGVRAFTALAYAHKPGLAADLNAWTLDFAARTPGAVPSATFYPEPGVNRYTRAAIDAGARVFHVHLELSDFNPAHSLLDAVWGVLAEAGLPVIVHPGTAVHIGLTALETVLRRHTRAAVIVANLGCPDYSGYLEMTERYERVALDTSMAFTAALEATAPFPRGQLDGLRELGLAGKVLLGTDFPYLPHAYAEQLSALAALDLGEEWLRAVCWDNAAKLFSLAS